MTLTDFDARVRTQVARRIAEFARPPSAGELAADLGCEADCVSRSLERLHDAHALLLHPDRRSLWVAHPFALSPGGCFVRAQGKGYWANCLYCALGAAAAMRCDAVITTRIGAEDETVVVTVERGEVNIGRDLHFHLSVPVRAWWDNVIHACASFQPFRSPSDVQEWCDRHGFPLGSTMTVPALWDFARDWYGGYLEPGWAPRSAAEAEELFRRHGLVGPFWSFPP